MGVRIEPVAAYHQFLNFYERAIQTYKNLMNTMKRSIYKSFYDQSDTLIELLQKHAMVDRVMSWRPILTKGKDSHETVVLACQLSKPSLGSKDVEDLMYGILLGKEIVQGQLLASIFDYKASILTTFHQNLLSYL